MKKTLLIVILLLVFSNAFATIYLRGIDLNEQSAHYIRVNIEYRLDKTAVYVDHGQNEYERFRRVTDEKGEKRYFVSTADVLNTFYDEGWELKTVVTETSGGSEGAAIHTDTHYIFERMKDK